MKNSDNKRLLVIRSCGKSGVVCIWDRHPKPGADYELWVWSENPKGWDIKFRVSLGGAVGRPPGTIYGTFLFLCGMAGQPGDDEHRLVAYDWTKKDCKELGIRNYGSKIHVLCYVEGTDVLPHGKPINGSSFLINPHFVKGPERFRNCNRCNCNCHFVGKVPGIKILECKCSQPYHDAYKFDIEDFAENGFRILNDTEEEEEVGPDISKKQLALKPSAGNPDAQGGKKKKKKKNT
ncbi:uncharacterized protein LOC131022379 isoform X2 [Salvia miltiorrhiza]|uniref:uncharacterized protein LOC131022379 isoform X2 n=1 Tax=Salvia miltiorrhiza TaxID=226208 RepID=UPI0025AC5700|nr:uncharacterized protein LOC131022379 isoform X2 [Salvia miltiorrhiza]